MPLHGWLPAAMVAPTPVSALLHAVAVVKAGAFGCLRVVGFVFGVDLMREIGADVVLAAVAAVTIILASIRALGEGHLKRRLAYSTIGQLSYIVLGAALGSGAALAGAIFHIAAHGAMKITMFFCAGAIYIRTHLSSRSRDLGGIGRRMPITMAAFAICAFGLAGLPLLAGFISKWNLGVGAVHAGHPVYVGVLIASGVLNFAYFFPIVYAAFFGPGPPAALTFDDNGPAMTAPLALTAVLASCSGSSRTRRWPLRLAWQAASSVTAPAREAAVNLWWLLAAVVAIGTVVAELVAGPYGYFHWHFIPAFDLVYGFVGCVAIILLSESGGKALHPAAGGLHARRIRAG
jgi:multicomponent Na+:H+ antiporter subunit D